MDARPVNTADAGLYLHLDFQLCLGLMPELLDLFRLGLWQLFNGIYAEAAQKFFRCSE